MKEFLKKNVFGPLKMTGTGFLDGDTADAGVYSCLEDMMIYEHALRHSPLVSAKMMERAWTPALLDDGRTIEYGYGWNVSNENDYVYHTGKWTGASTWLSLDQASGVSIIVLSGIDDTAPPLAEAIEALEE